MNVLLFGATGMIGQGVLRECLLDPEVASVLTIGRRPTGQPHAKLRELTHEDLGDLTAIEHELSGHDACFYCLGVSSAGMSETEYTRVTYGFTMAAAGALARLNPGMTFIYVTGAGSDSTERGSSMWARVKGRTENALLKLPFKAAYMFRPAIVQPLHGIRSKTALYQVFYSLLGWSFPLWKALLPRHVTTTEILGRAMLEAAKRGARKKVLETPDINALGALAVQAGGAGVDGGARI